VALESVEASVAAGWVASVVAAGGSEAGGGRAFGLPGVIVSTAAVLPILEAEAAFALGCKLNPMVSSPDSLAGVMVGGPLRAAAETSGLVFRTPMLRLIIPS
jgi:hypothetical protein